MPKTLKIIQQFPSHTSRPRGREAFDVVSELLEDNDKIVLDFDESVMTPSFADELIGGLVSQFGADEFNRRVTLLGMAEDTEALVRHVIKRRRSRSIA